MSKTKKLRISDLTGEQLECLRDTNRRAEAHGMLDDLRDRCGYDVEALRATLPPLGAFREVIEKYTERYESTTGGGCMALTLPCRDGTYIQITDTDGTHIPEDDEREVLVGRYDAEGPIDLTPGRPVGEEGCVEVPTGEMEALIDEIFEDAERKLIAQGARIEELQKKAPTAERLAEVFSRIVRERLAAHLATIRQLNSSRTDSTCAPHDFCDANMLMHEALCECLGVKELPAGLVNHTGFHVLWNEAWDRAKRNGFR